MEQIKEININLIATVTKLNALVSLLIGKGIISDEELKKYMMMQLDSINENVKKIMNKDEHKDSILVPLVQQENESDEKIEYKSVDKAEKTYADNCSDQDKLANEDRTIIPETEVKESDCKTSNENVDELKSNSIVLEAYMVEESLSD